MNGASFALSILGLDKTELLFCNLLLDLYNQKRYGEIPGKNLRDLLGLTKETLFELLKALAELEILTKIHKRESISQQEFYIDVGGEYYTFTPDPLYWTPRGDSLFYQICKQQNLKTNAESYEHILEDFNIFDDTRKSREGVKDDSLKTYGLYEHFCKQYKRVFGQTYKAKNINRDLVHAKNVLFEARMKGMKDGQIKDFVDWAVRTERSDIIMGFLPIRLNEYFVKHKVQVYGDKAILDENGHLKAIS